MRTKLKFIILLLISILGLRGVAKAQLYHVKGIKGINAEVGSYKNGVSINANYQKMFKKNMRYSFGTEIYLTKSGVTKDRKYFIKGNFHYTIFNVKQRFFLEGVTGFGIGLEKVKDEVANQTKTAFCVKEMVGLSIEFCITEKLSINLFTKQNLFQLNRNGMGVFNYGIGLTINI